MIQEKYDERMCRLIWHDALQCSVKTLSWGIDFTKVKVIRNGTEFPFQGLMITGIVRIQYVEGSGLFRITVVPDNRQEKTVVMDDVCIDRLVSVIDEYVGYCGNYEKRISEEYRLGEKLEAV